MTTQVESARGSSGGQKGRYRIMWRTYYYQYSDGDRSRMCKNYLVYDTRGYEHTIEFRTEASAKRIKSILNTAGSSTALYNMVRSLPA